jgi:GLPGLI family protein
MKRTLIAAIFLLTVSAAFCQFARFPVNGVIEFEKKVNMFSVIKKEINKENEAFLTQAFEQYKKNQPQFRTFKSTLSFSKDKTLFSPVESSEPGPNFFSWHPASMQPNTVYTDLEKGNSSIQKRIFEQTYLVKDSVRKINWKITSELRDIAGYACRRANAVIMDSIYVVAFFTEQIPVSGGPETFSGLPGMILGVALPHEHITWFATSVTDKPLEKAIMEPTKGKPLDYRQLRTTLESSMKQHGSFLQTALKGFML